MDIESQENCSAYWQPNKTVVKGVSLSAGGWKDTEGLSQLQISMNFNPCNDRCSL